MDFFDEDDLRGLVAKYDDTKRRLDRAEIIRDLKTLCGEIMRLREVEDATQHLNTVEGAIEDLRKGIEKANPDDYRPPTWLR
jgi:hypothetical protein